jgi:hypothetical protein
MTCKVAHAFDHISARTATSDHISARTATFDHISARTATFEEDDPNRDSISLLAWRMIWGEFLHTKTPSEKKGRGKKSKHITFFLQQKTSMESDQSSTLSAEIAHPNRCALHLPLLPCRGNTQFIFHFFRQYFILINKFVIKLTII